MQHVEVARAAGGAIEKALSGELEDYRLAIEATYGEWHLRKEVM